MNLIKRNQKRIVVSVLILAITGSSLIYNFFVKADNSKNNYSNVARDTSISVDANDNLKITRNKKEQLNSEAEDEWTILIYMDGSDLETNFGYATKDLREIMSARIAQSTVDKVNIVVQTGGSALWYLHDLEADKSQRFLIDSIGGPTLIEETEQKNMGDPETLADFISWGVEKYPAKRTGLILWNHGTGVSNGVCADLNFNEDALMLPEIEYALAKSSKNMKSQFEFIGFDACLSGSVEYANAFATYAKYMIASSDFEPGTGWEYKSIMNQILDNPTSTGLEVGKVVCDSYYNEIVKKDKKAKATMALLDLSKIDNVCYEVNKLSKYMYEQLLKDKDAYTRFGHMQNATERITYGTARENMDLGSLAYYFEVVCDYTYETAELKNALEDLIVYQQISSNYKQYHAVGLSIYYPTKALSIKETNIMRNVEFSPYYLKYMEYLSYLRQEKTKDKYQSIDWENSEFFYEKDFSFLNYYRQKDTDDKTMIDLLSQNMKYVADGFIERWKNNIVGGSSVNINYQYYDPNSPYTHRNIAIADRNGNYVANINNEDKENISRVYNGIFIYIDDNLVCLGEDKSATYNKETGEIVSNFNEEWWMLPDGQLLTVDIEEGVGETIYCIPVYVNDMEMTIKFRETIEENGEVNYEVLGLWDAISTSEYEGRGYIPLEKGMKICPIYNIYSLETGEYESEYGEEYTIESDFDFLLGKLDKSEYKFAFEIEDINGMTSYSKIAE